MFKYIVTFLVLTILTNVGHSQWQLDTLFTVRQESIPLNDSGGRWLSSAIIFNSSSAYPQHISINTQGSASDYGLYILDSVWILPDSAYFIADSIFTGDFFNPIRSSNPRKYADSLNIPATLDFVLLAHATLRIPIKVRAITQKGAPGDTVLHPMGFYSTSDSAGIIRYSLPNFSIRCITMYSAPLGVWQESVPPNDSGGRWLPSWIVAKSVSPYTVHINFATDDAKNNYPNPPDTSWKTADSALYLADSIFISENGAGNFTSATPWKYIDSLDSYPGDTRNFHAVLDIPLPPIQPYEYRS